MCMVMVWLCVCVVHVVMVCCSDYLTSLSTVEFLHSRSWQGLEQRLGETSVENAVQGECGIPRMYSHELEQLDQLVHA